MHFAVDDITGKATLIGNAGVADVFFFTGSRGTTFIEQSSSGAVQTTTVDSAGHSVHSRHTMIDGNLIPSQSYGNCVNE